MRTIIILIIIFYSQLTYAQRFAAFSDGFVAQHWLNKIYYNPAATGHENKKVVSLTGGFHGSLSEIDRSEHHYNALATYEQPIKQTKSSVGFAAAYIYKDNYLSYKRFSAVASYSYALPLGEEKFLRFGAQVGLVSLKAESGWGGDMFKINDQGPVLNAGLFFNSKTFYGGLAVKSINSPVFQSDKIGGAWVNFKEDAKINVMAGNTFFAEKTFQWKPNILIVTDFGRTYMQLNNNFCYKNKYTFGATVLLERINTLALNAGLKLDDKFELGVNYEIPARDFIVNQGVEISSRFLF